MKLRELKELVKIKETKIKELKKERVLKYDRNELNLLSFLPTKRLTKSNSISHLKQYIKGNSLYQKVKQILISFKINQNKTKEELIIGKKYNYEEIILIALKFIERFYDNILEKNEEYKKYYKKEFNAVKYKYENKRKLIQAKKKNLENKKNWKN